MDKFGQVRHPSKLRVLPPRGSVHLSAMEVLNSTANSNDFTRLDFLESQTAGGKMFAKVLEAIARRMEYYDGDTATLHILLVAKLVSMVISTSNSGSATARSSPFCFPDHPAS